MGRYTSGLVGLCWVVPRTPFVTSPVWQFIHRFGRSTLSSPRTSGDGATTRGTAGLLSQPVSSNSEDVLPVGIMIDAPAPALSAGVPSVHPSAVPFVSCRAGAYGRLLLATHERMMTGGLVACDWLRPVTWRAWRVAPPISVVTHTAAS